MTHDLRSMTPSEVAKVAESMEPMERKLLLGECNGWGGWMWEAGKRLVSLGLGTRSGGNIQFDTPLAEAVRDYLRRSQ